MIYTNAFHAAFVFDDHYFIVDDKAVHISELNADTLQTAAIEGKPRHRYLPNISFAVNYYFGQLNPFGYHVVNLAIHLLTGIFLFLFLKSTLQIYPRTFSVGSRVYPRPEREGINPSPTMTEKIINTADSSPELIAFCAALLWLVQPVGTQAVTYICQRMASMVAMFYILSLLLYVKGRLAMTGEKTKMMQRGGYPPRHSGRGSEATETRNPDACPGKSLIPILYFTGCALAALCAFATKENAGTLPIVILLYEWFFFQDLKLQWSRRQLLWAGIFVLIFLAGVFWYMGENPFNRLFNSYNRRDFTMIERVMTELRIVVYYISLFLWAPPGRLNLDHDYPLSVSPMAPAVTIVAFLAIIALLWISVYTAKKHRLMAFAVLWFFLTQATESTIIGIELIFEHRTYLPFMLVSLMAILGIQRLVKPAPAAFVLISVIALIFSAWTFQRNTHWKEPVTFWRDCTLKSPEKYRPYLNLGLLNYENGNMVSAMANFKKSLELNSDCAGCLINIGLVLDHQGNINEAIAHYQTALKIVPASVDAHLNLGNALSQKGLIEEANRHYRIVLDIDPYHTAAQLNFGKNLIAMKMIDEAIKHFEQAIKLDPDSATLYLNAGNAHAQKSDFSKAIVYYTKALKINPGYKEIYTNLGNIYFRKGRLNEALYYYEKNISESLENQNAHRNRKALLNALPPEGQVALLFNTANKFVIEKDPDHAILLLKEILTINPDEPIIYYNIACLFAIQNQTQKAIRWLQQAVNKGYQNWDKIKTDPDLANLKNKPEYKNFLKQQTN